MQFTFVVALPVLPQDQKMTTAAGERPLNPGTVIVICMAHGALQAVAQLFTSLLLTTCPQENSVLISDWIRNLNKLLFHWL